LTPRVTVSEIEVMPTESHDSPHDDSPGESHASAPDLLALHGVRIMGMTSSAAVAARYRLDAGEVEEHLLDGQARGWVRTVGFAGISGWTITDEGRTENERRLADELELAGARELVVRAHQDFVPLNRRLGAACTRWQLRPSPGDPMAFNDHTDHRWDDRVLRELESLSTSLRAICDRLVAGLARFDGHADGYADALAEVSRGRYAWVDAPDRRSCHTVWVQFHEDLLATLGLPRGSDN
jgi:hypothetical protein